MITAHQVDCFKKWINDDGWEIIKNTSKGFRAKKINENITFLKKDNEYFTKNLGIDVERRFLNYQKRLGA